MIQKLLIKNFRSIKEAEITLGRMNAFVGRNNAGKSNIMRALHLGLGEVYPSARSFDEKDFHNYDKSAPISIEVQFAEPLAINQSVYGFRLSFDGTQVEYVAVDSSGETVRYFNGREVRVSNEMRDEVALMYLGLERQAAQQVRPAQWTLYGKLLRHIERQISASQRDAFRAGIDATFKTHIEPDLVEMENILRGHVKQQTGLDLHLRLSVQDPIETLKNLRPYLHGSSPREFDAEDMGAGTQSALAIAIARAYAEIVRKPLTLAIEEPELYLHPHGCRHFRRLLEELAKAGIQVIYTTHERSFVDIAHFERIHLVRNEAGQTKVASGIEQPTLAAGDLKLVSKFDRDVNEVFFANKVVLVEGPGDRIACELALEKLGVEIDKESISVTECGGIGDIKAIAEVLQALDIPVYALVDEDPSNPTTEAVVTQLKASMGEGQVGLQKPNLEGQLGLPGKLNKTQAIASLPKWFEENPMPSPYVDLRDWLGAVPAE